MIELATSLNEERKAAETKSYNPFIQKILVKTMVSRLEDDRIVALNHNQFKRKLKKANRKSYNHFIQSILVKTVTIISIKKS